MSDKNSYMVFSGTATRYLAEKICQSLGCPLGELQITKFSDGEFQKACIATALTKKANVIMLDEPTAFLDVENRIMVLQTLQRLAHETGSTVIFSTHDIHDGVIYSDTVLAL